MEDTISYCREEWEEVWQEVKVNEMKEMRKKNQQEEEPEEVNARGDGKYMKEDRGERRKNEREREMNKSDVTLGENGKEKERKEKTREEENKGKQNVAKAGETNSAESPVTKEDLTKAIVVYGNQSPMTGVLKGIERMKLKRDREDEEEREVRKRRKLIFTKEKAASDARDASPQRKGRRKCTAVRRAKGRAVGRGGRNKREVMGMVSTEVMVIAETNAGDHERQLRERIEVWRQVEGEVEAEGSGGWPKSATGNQ